MGTEKEIIVEYKREGDETHHLWMGFKPMSDILINYADIPRDERGGTATRLLCASALYCFASTLGEALLARGVKINSLSGRAIAEKTQDDYKRTKVSRICICLEVDVDDEYLPILEKCRQIAERGCFITYSLEEGMDVEKRITRTRKGKKEITADK